MEVHVWIIMTVQVKTVHPENAVVLNFWKNNENLIKKN